MVNKKIINLGNKTLELLRRGDKGINKETLEELEGPMSEEDNMQITSLDKIKEVLEKHKRELIGEREQVSNGIFGPLYKINFKDKDGSLKSLLERCFVRTHDWEKRAEVEGLFGESHLDSEPRFNFFSIDNKGSRFIVDYLYNEDMALSKLQGIEGIPAYYGSVDEGALYGSTMQEFIDGYDLSMITKEEIDNLGFSLEEILVRLKRIYQKAAESGFILNKPSEATIMINKEGKPYITDWHLYSQGDIFHEGPMKDLYIKGLCDLEEMIKNKLI